MESPLRAALHRAWALMDGAGRAAFTPEQLRHAAVFVLIAGADGLRGHTLPEPAEAYLGALGAKLGLRPGASAEAMADALADHFRRYPVHPALLQAAQRACADDTGTPRWGLAARAVVELLEVPPLAGLFDAGPARVTGGPLAQAALAPRAPKRKRSRRDGA